MRELFDIPDNVTYLNIAGISPLLKTVAEIGQKSILEKSHPWVIGPEQFFDRLERVRNLFAKLIHTQSDHIAIVPSATYGVETAVKNILLKKNLDPTHEILVQAEEFPALVLPLQKLSKHTGAQLITVPRPPLQSWTSAVLQRINKNTKVIAVSHSHWTDGTVLDIKTVTQAARGVNATVLVDGCQSLGVIDFNVNDIQPDYLFAPTYKWLLGPYTFGFMYVAPHLHNEEPLEEYWASRKGSDDFAKLTDYEPQYQAGARRFDMSERGQFIHTPMAIRALEQIQSWSVETISKKIEPMTDFIAEQALKKGYTVAPKVARSPHFIGIKKDHTFTDEFKNKLLAKNIHVGYRGEWMRISPYLYNSEQDIDRLIQEI